MGVRGWIGFGVIIAICVTLVIGDAVVHGPLREKLRSTTRALAVAEKENAYVAGHATSLEHVGDYLPREVEGVNEAEQRFLSEISETLQRSGMVLTRVEPRRVTQEGTYTRRSFKLEIECSYRDFANFLRYLEMMPEVVVINSFELNSGRLRKAKMHSATMKLTVIGY